MASESTELIQDPLRSDDLGELYDYSHVPNDEGHFASLFSHALNNQEFHEIARRDNRGWWTNSTLDLALKIMARRYSAKRYGIAIQPTGFSWALHTDFVGRKEHPNDTLTGVEAMKHYMHEIEGRNWIFVPVSPSQAELDFGQVYNTHWCLLAVNRSARIAHYIDSYASSATQRIVQRVATSLGLLFDEQYQLRREYFSPNQTSDFGHHRQFGNEAGACGPYVFTMTLVYVKRIIRCTYKNQQVQLGLTRQFPAYFRQQYNSLQIRFDVANYILYLRDKNARYLRRELGLSPTLRNTWDQHDERLIEPIPEHILRQL